MLDRAVAVGVSSVVLTGVDLKSIRHNVAAATAYQGRAQLRCTAGVHPHHSTGGMTPTILAELRKHLAHPQVAAVGECGLDFNRKLSPHPDQISMFKGQLALAVELKMPVFCHVRDADLAALQVLDSYAGRLPPVVIHCFTGTAADARAYLDRGFFIGFTGTVCKFERGRHLRELLPGVPLDRIMLETDTPYMGFVKGRRHSEPADTVGVAQKIAEVKGVPFEEVCRVTTATADAFFGFHAPYTY
jgi:TatD family hydrolase